MRKIFILTLLICSLGASAQNLQNLVNGLRNRGTNSGSSTENTENTNNGGALGALGDFINNTIANNNFSVEELQGKWDYSSPAVSFESANVLQGLGGTAAATALEGQLEPYYTRLGFNHSSLEVDSLNNFTLKLGAIQLKGKVEKSEDDKLVFNFNAFNRIPLGKVSANAKKAGNMLNITFDATKLIHILNQVAGRVNIGTLNTVTSLLNSYDGVYIGFKMRRH